MKVRVPLVLAGLMVATLGFAFSGHGQSKQTEQSAKQVPPTGGTLKTEDLLKIRDLQYEQAKRLLEMRQIEARYRELQEATVSGQQQIDDAVRAGAAAANVDLKQWVFDADRLKFIPRAAEKPPEKKD